MNGADGHRGGGGDRVGAVSELSAAISSVVQGEIKRAREHEREVGSSKGCSMSEKIAWSRLSRTSQRTTESCHVTRLLRK